MFTNRYMGIRGVAMYIDCGDGRSTLLKIIKVLHDAIECIFLSKLFHKEPLSSEEPFCFTKGSLWQKKVLQIIKR